MTNKRRLGADFADAGDLKTGHEDFGAFLRQNQVNTADCAVGGPDGEALAIGEREPFAGIGQVTAEGLIEDLGASPHMQPALDFMRDQGVLLCVEGNPEDPNAVKLDEMMGQPAVIINPDMEIGWDETGQTRTISYEGLLFHTASALHGLHKDETHTDYGGTAYADITDELGAGFRLNRFYYADNALAGLEAVQRAGRDVLNVHRDHQTAVDSDYMMVPESSIGAVMARVMKATGQSPGENPGQARRALFDSAFSVPGTFDAADRTFVDTHAYIFGLEGTDHTFWENAPSIAGTQKAGPERLRINGQRPGGNFLEGGQNLQSDFYLRNIGADTARGLIALDNWLDGPREPSAPEDYGYEGVTQEKSL